MAACAHCGGCCAHCASVCGGFHGVSPFVLGNAFHTGGGGGLMPLYGGVGYMPYLGGEPLFFHHRHKKGEPEVTDDNQDDEKFKEALAEQDHTAVHCDALVDHDHPDHRAAVQAVAHSDEAAHKSLLQRVKDELAKL